MVLIVRFFQRVFELETSNGDEMLLMALSIAAICFCVYLSHRGMV
jgi:hypothetical protein